jgi:hypothetical protein
MGEVYKARAAAALTHPNILAVHDIGMHESSPCIVSELLHGTTGHGGGSAQQLRRHARRPALPPSILQKAGTAGANCNPKNKKARAAAADPAV